MATDDLTENDRSEAERRAYERYSVEFYLSVYNRDTDALMGHVVHISMGGMQVLSATPVVSGELFRFRMDVSLEMGGMELIELEARSVWQTADLSSGFYNSGFQFLDLSPAAARSIQAIIEKLVSSM